MLFALPLVAAFAPLGRVWLAVALVALAGWQPPVVVTDLTRAGAPEARADFYRPLVEELARRAPVGRVEVVPLRDHWEAAYVARAVPLARGWERQVDVDRNPLFYDGRLDPDRYARWLRDNAVSYVALAVDSPPDRYARAEAALVRAGQAYLRPVWRDARWRLYEVVDPQPLVAATAPGRGAAPDASSQSGRSRLVSSGRAEVSFTVDAPGDVLVRVRWSRWLALRGPGGCLAPGPDGWTTVRVSRAGRHALVGALRPGPRC
jgi:hypothetical protein